MVTNHTLREKEAASSTSPQPHLRSKKNPKNPKARPELPFPKKKKKKSAPPLTQIFPRVTPRIFPEALLVSQFMGSPPF